MKITVCSDPGGRTCIEVGRTKSKVKYIVLDLRAGLKVKALSAETFDGIYKQITGYPTDKACQLYLRYSQDCGASREALQILKKNS